MNIGMFDMSKYTWGTNALNEDSCLDNYWKKKTIVSFVLSIFVMFIHMSSFSQYSYQDSSCYEIINFVKIITKNSFARVAVPLFFMMSGATLFRKYEAIQYKTILIKRIKTLLIPYFCWNIINVIFSIITSYSFVSNYFVGRQKIELSFSNLFYSIFFYKGNIPHWFLFALIIFTLATPMFDYITEKKRIGCVIIAMLITIENFCDLVRLPEMMYFESEAIVYYLIGCFIGKHYFGEFIGKVSKRIYILSGILFVIITVYKVGASYDCFKALKMFDILIMIIYAFSFWFISDVFVNKVSLKSYMGNSFFIYMTHVNISAIIIKLFYLIFPKTPLMSIANFIVSALLTIVVICITCSFLRRFMPAIYKILSGNR